MTKLNTINVIETLNGSISQIISFEDTENGNTEAERIFLKILSENISDIFSDENKQFILEEGFYNDKNGYLLSLVDSN